MGVLSCHRRDCENIMCDYYSSDFGYLCNECYNELLEKCDEMTISQFMASPKNDVENLMGEDAVKEAFRNRYEDED